MAIEDGRIARVEGILEEVRARLNNLEGHVSRLQAQMQTQLYWLLGVIVTMWVTIILAVLLRG